MPPRIPGNAETVIPVCLMLHGQRLEQAGQMLSQVWGVHEFILLNTCNRVEVHAVVSRQADVVPLLARILRLDRLDYVRAECPELEDSGILVLGSGMVGLGIARRLSERGRRVDLCYHMHRPDLRDAWKEHVRLFTFDDLRDRLAKADLVICATDSPHYVVMAEHAPCFGPTRPILICDLTMPRNVDPALSGLRANLRIADLEDLKHWYRREMADLGKIFELSVKTVSDHKDLYERLIRKEESHKHTTR